MLSDLRRALCEAIAESNDVHRTWSQLKAEGYSLFLLVDCKRQEEGPSEDRRDTPAAGQPAFRINGGDLSFLKSIGIDPTRRGRRRRSGQSSR